MPILSVSLFDCLNAYKDTPLSCFSFLSVLEECILPDCTTVFLCGDHVTVEPG